MLPAHAQDNEAAVKSTVHSFVSKVPARGYSNSYQTFKS